MTANELREKYMMLYDYMSTSRKTEYMMTFGKVMSEMMEDMISNSPSKAEEYIEKLCSIKWHNYLTQREAEKIVGTMNPKAPWSRDQWKSAMDQHGFQICEEPAYNPCALWVVMNMVMSDSSETLSKYISNDNMFEAVHDLAVDKLTDIDGNFNIRDYFFK